MASISPLLPSTHHLHNQFPLKILSLAKAVSSSPPYPSAIIPRRSFVAGVSITTPFLLPFSASSIAADFYEIEGSDGVKSLELRTGEGEVPSEGDQKINWSAVDVPVEFLHVAIHYYGRLAAKQGWRFDSTYDHKDEMGNPIPFVFIIGSSKVISGIEVAVKSMKVGGILRVIIPPSQGYQNRSQEPIPPDFFDRQRLFTTIFNPTRLANGESSTLGTLIFDIELVSLRHP